METTEDVDSAFDDIVLFENSSQEQGYKEGFSKGSDEGFVDGYVYGCKHGVDVGSEIGFYKGFATVWKNILQKEEGTTKNSRILSTLNTVLLLIEDFPMDNPQNTRIQEIMLNMRAKFKQACSLLNIQANPTDAEKPGISF